MKTPKVNRKPWIGISPWIILGAVTILVPIFVFWTLKNIDQQKENTTRLLLEKGAALIRSFEAGARTGMMRMRWGGLQVQRLLEETAKQSDIVHLLVTDVKGTILAHSDFSKVGQTYATELKLERISRSHNAEWRQITGQDGSRVFEVFRQFSPIRGHFHRQRRRMMRNDWCRSYFGPEKSRSDAGQIIFVGLDMEPIEAARRDDTRHTTIMALILLLIGFAGIVSLFLAQAYRSTKTSLLRVEAFSDNLVENMPVGLAALDAEGRIASFNQTAESVLGISAREALGRKAREVLPDPLLSLIYKLKTRDRIIGREMDCPLRDGKLIPLDVSATLLQEKGGAFMGHLILFRDLSEIRSLKKEVERSERLASIGRLAAGIAHEIRNPLSSIKGFATYFKERYSKVPEDQKTAEIMIQEVERLNRVIGQLLEFARPMSIQEKPTSLQTLIQLSLKMIEGEALKHGIEINLTTSPEIDKVQIDPDRFKQVLLNLYLNAMEAMEKGGVLTVDLRRDDEGKNIQIRISDRGTGIKQEDLARIFDPYFTTKPSGTGLGLAIVYNIVEAHGGDVRVESRLGEGTTVSVSLPSSKEI